MIFTNDSASFLCELYLYSLFSGTNKFTSTQSLAAKRTEALLNIMTVAIFFALLITNNAKH